MSEENWLPLENNPESLNVYIKKLGFNSEKFSFKELLSFEDWAFDMIGTEILGCLLLFPYTDKHNEHLKQEEVALLKDGYKKPEDIFFMKQYASNACGSIGIFHMLLNLKNKSELIANNSILDNFYTANKDKSPKDIGKIFKSSKNILQAHVDTVKDGETEVCEEVNLHFVSILPINGKLYEFDGHKEFPICHGEINDTNYKQLYTKVFNHFLSINPGNLNFSINFLSNN